jgi:hypothetical protein
MLVFPWAFVLRSAVDPGVCCAGHPPSCKRDQLRADAAHAEMEPIGNLDSLGRALPSAFGVRAGAIAHDDLNTRVVPQPVGEDVGCSIVEQVNRTVGLEVKE